MTKPAKNNPPSQDNAPAQPGKALRTARVLIAVGLFVGIAVFAVYAIEELKAGPPGATPPTDFGAADVERDTPQPADDKSLAGLAKPDPAKYIPINHPPGRIPPYRGTAPLGQPPYRQPMTGEVWEFCVYELRDADMDELIAYYDSQAKGRGLEQVKLGPTSENIPGGIKAAWSDGKDRLEITIKPLKAPRTTAPLAPKTPLRWVVKYSYPEPTAKP